MKVHFKHEERLADPHTNNFLTVISRVEKDIDSTEPLETFAALYGATIYERNGKHFYTIRLDSQRIAYIEYTVEE